METEVRKKDAGNRVSGRAKSSSRRLQTVLIVDDDPDTCSALQVFLSHFGYKTAVASSTVLALETALAFQPTLVLLDYHIPGKLPTQDLISALRSNGVQKIVLMSGVLNPLKVAHSLGLAHVLQKPFDFSEIEKIMQQASA